MRTRTALAGLAVSALTAGSMAFLGATAQAQPAVPGPGTAICLDVTARLNAALDDVLQLNPDVIGTITTRDALTASVLATLKADPDAGQGAQEEIQLAANLRVEALAACTAPTSTPTPTPTPTPTGTPTPDVDPPFESCAEAREAGVDTPIITGEEAYSLDLDADADGVACEDDEDELVLPDSRDDEDDDSAFPIGGVDTGWTR